MRRFLFFVVAIFLLWNVWACVGDNVVVEDKKETQDSLDHSSKINQSDLFKNEEERLKARKDKVFRPILDSAGRADKKNLLRNLSQQYGSPFSESVELNQCKYSKFYGYKDSIWILELKTGNEALCPPYGTQLQYIFDAQGHLIYEDSAALMEMLVVWEDKAPLLMTIATDCKGTGQHHFYKYESGQLIDIFNVLMESTPLTYDAEASTDAKIYKPEMLALKLMDKNKDGRNDLVFSGQRLILKGPDDKKYTEMNPYKRESVEYIFLYEPIDDWFVAERSHK